MAAQNVLNTYAQTTFFNYNTSNAVTSLLNAGQSVGTLSFAANSLSVGDHIYLWAAGEFRCLNGAAPGTLQFNLGFGGLTVQTPAMNLPINTNSFVCAWRIHGMIACRNTTQAIYLVLDTDHGMSQQVWIQGSTLMLDRTVANSIGLASQFSVSNLNNSVTIDVATVEYLTAAGL